MKRLDAFILGMGWGAAGVLAFVFLLFPGLHAILGPDQYVGTYVTLQSLLAILASMVVYAARGREAAVGALLTGLAPLAGYALDRASLLDLAF